MSLTPYQPTLDWVAAQQARMEMLTEQWSAINSGSYHMAGLARMLTALESEFAHLKGDMHYVSMAPLPQINAQGEVVELPIADALSIVKRPEAPIQILLVGHMDTVYGPDHPFQIPRKLPGNILNGPGAADLKGGLVVMLHALLAFEQSPYAEKLGWQIILNTDEEIGSISSDPLLKQAAVGKALALVYEPAQADGSLAGARKGSGNFSIVIKGRAAHAGRNPQDGRNAIVAAAELTTQIMALNGSRPGLTLNPAKIEGGSALNVVPDIAVLRFNIRTADSADETDVLAQIQALIGQLNSREGYHGTLHGRFTRSPKPMHPKNQKLFDFVLSCGRELGLEIGVKPSGGCCDGNNLWKYGLANVDTLGVRGANIHSPEEIAYLDSLTERAQLSALLLCKLAAGEFAT